MDNCGGIAYTFFFLPEVSNRSKPTLSTVQTAYECTLLWLPPLSCLTFILIPFGIISEIKYHAHNYLPQSVLRKPSLRHLGMWQYDHCKQ